MSHPFAESGCETVTSPSDIGKYLSHTPADPPSAESAPELYWRVKRLQVAARQDRLGGSD